MARQGRSNEEIVDAVGQVEAGEKVAEAVGGSESASNFSPGERSSFAPPGGRQESDVEAVVADVTLDGHILRPLHRSQR